MLNFINVDLPPQNNGTTNIKVTYLGDIKGVTVESTIDVQSVGSLQDALLRPQPAFRVSKFLGYFKIKDNRKILPKELCHVEIEIKYSLVAWDLAKEKGESYPKVAYLPRVKNSWGDEWILFDNNDSDVDIAEVRYEEGSPYRYLRIRHQQLPDPLIGGC